MSASALLCLLLPLQAALSLGSDSQVEINKPVTLQVTWTASFYNRTSGEHWISGWLDDLQTHGWNSSSGKIIFLYPWARGNESKEWPTLERSIKVIIVTFHTDIFVFHFEYLLEMQFSKGCRLHSGNVVEGFFWITSQGSDFLSFQNDSCSPSPMGGKKAQSICQQIRQHPSIKGLIHRHIYDVCSRILSGILDAGKAHLQRQERPECWLSTAPSPEPVLLQLVCHVSGFYPKPVWVMWMRGEKELPETQRGDELPNADDTWYLRVTLDVAVKEANGLSCRVKHSSLAGQDIVLHWESTEHHSSLGVILVAVMVPLTVLAGLVFWFGKRWMSSEAAPNVYP
ncbi:T-cell surface glycoprotein CD1a-like [Octodon degus]|uniref:T-cell surface glycoprotein CD1a-like n=1 Tax=Octodon degus TaxID=10160 RepID=A0A6P6DWU6_OCTDE|nr:T-cell surface glycoprotein CD1a-like [Octodon degus]